MTRDYLLYTSAGRASNVRQWYSSAKRNYDIWITNYTTIPSLNREYGDFYNEREGSKFQNLKAVFVEHRAFLSRYKAIMVSDDDIIISPGSLSALFTTLENRGLWLLQPAFSRFGKISHPITARRLTSQLRYTNFVEVTCPIFRTDKLFDVLSAYDPEVSTCCGLDYWFSYVLGPELADRVAISDKLHCINPRDWLKPGGRREINTLNSSEQRVRMVDRILHDMGIRDFVYKEYRKEPRNLMDSVCSIPLFTLEVLFGRVHAFASTMKRWTVPASKQI